MKNFWKDSNIIYQVIFFLLIIILAILVILVLVKEFSRPTNDQDQHNKNTNPEGKEISQTYKPSIGDALAPDIIPPEATKFVAPTAGIDETQPIHYENTRMQFKAVLPAYSQIHEDTDSVKFTSKGNSLFYIISVHSRNSETLASVEKQLRNSPDIYNLTYTKLNSIKTLQFDAIGYGSGLVFIQNDKIYYLLGNKQYFTSFQLL